MMAQTLRTCVEGNLIQASMGSKPGGNSVTGHRALLGSHTLDGVPRDNTSQSGDIPQQAQLWVPQGG